MRTYRISAMLEQYYLLLDTLAIQERNQQSAQQSIAEIDAQVREWSTRSQGVQRFAPTGRAEGAVSNPTLLAVEARERAMEKYQDRYECLTIEVFDRAQTIAEIRRQVEPITTAIARLDTQDQLIVYHHFARERSPQLITLEDGIDLSERAIYDHLEDIDVRLPVYLQQITSGDVSQLRCDFSTEIMRKSRRRHAEKRGQIMLSY